MTRPPSTRLAAARSKLRRGEPLDARDRADLVAAVDETIAARERADTPPSGIRVWPDANEDELHGGP